MLVSLGEYRAVMVGVWRGAALGGDRVCGIGLGRGDEEGYLCDVVDW